MTDEIKEIAQTDQVRAMTMMIADAEPRLQADGWEKYEDKDIREVYFYRYGVRLFPDFGSFGEDFGECYWVAFTPKWILNLPLGFTLCVFADTPEAALAKLESLLRQDFERILSGLFGPKTTNNKETEK